MTHIDRINAFVDHGWLGKCSGLQIKVWLFLHRRADGRTGKNAFPSLATIASAVGNTRRRVSEALRELLTLGLIEQTCAATFTTSAVYRLCDPLGQSEGEVSKTDTPDQIDIEGANSGGARNEQETPAHFGQETPAQNGSPIRTITRTNIRTRARAMSASGFDRWWNAYPNTSRRVDRAGCLKKWIAWGLEDRADELVRHVDACKRSEQWSMGKEPMTTTYLNQKRFESAPPQQQSRINGHRFAGAGALPEGREDGQ